MNARAITEVIRMKDMPRKPIKISDVLGALLEPMIDSEIEGAIRRRFGVEGGESWRAVEAKGGGTSGVRSFLSWTKFPALSAQVSRSILQDASNLRNLVFKLVSCRTAYEITVHIENEINSPG